MSITSRASATETVDLQAFIELVIDDGIRSAPLSIYDDGGDGRVGSIAGFVACRGKTPFQLHTMLRAAELSVQSIPWKDERRRFHNQYLLKVRWVCNCVSVVLIREGRTPIVDQPAYGWSLKVDRLIRGTET